MDYGCVAPAKVFVAVFAEQGVDITLSEARAPMGTFKRDHIQAITRMPRVAQCWQQVHGRAPHEEDVDTLYTAFTPKQIAIITDYSALIPGVKKTVQDPACPRGKNWLVHRLHAGNDAAALA